jgi:ribosome biogenesis SPOUT family RNA methylase Rps3
VLLTQPQDHSINPSKSSEPPTDKKFPTMLSPIGEHRPSPGVLDHSLNTVNLNQYLGDETKYLIDEFHQGKSKLFSPENFNDISLLIPNQQLEPIDFSRINPKTALGKTQKVSEFIVLSLSKHIRLKPENIVQFLVEKSKLLTMVIVSGIKGDYRPIIHFYEDIFTYLENLMKMALSDGSLATVKSLINTIKPGFVSKSKEIAKWTCRIFSKMAYICHKEQILDRAFEIFIEEGTFIKILLLCIRRHFELKTAVLEVLTEFGKENFVTLFEIHLRANLAEGATYLKFTYEYLEQLFGTPKTWEYIDNNYTVENWIKEIFKYTKFVISNSNETRMYSFYVIIDIWMKYPNFMINS